MESKTKDTQIVEIAGHNWLVNELYRNSIEAARPERDHGIDLIAFIDLNDSGRFVARPIQMKAATDEGFGIWRKFEKFPDLLIAYIWHVTEPKETICFCLTYAEAVSVAERMGYTKTKSWLEDGVFITTKPGKQLRQLLEPFRMMSEEAWRLKISPELEYDRLFPDSKDVPAQHKREYFEKIASEAHIRMIK